MESPSWANDLDAGLGALIAELEAAESGQTGLGKSPDWESLKTKAAAVKAGVASALADFSQQSVKLQNAAKYIDQLKQQMSPGTGRPAPGLGPTGGQTVFLSAGATAGIAAGALLIGAVGGFATKAIIDSGKDKKKAEEKALKEAPEEEEEENRPRKGGKR
jgi:hypothetical protein